MQLNQDVITTDPETYIKTINEAHKVAYGGFDGKSTWYKQAGQGHIEIHRVKSVGRVQCATAELKKQAL